MDQHGDDDRDDERVDREQEMAFAGEFLNADGGRPIGDGEPLTNGVEDKLDQSNGRGDGEEEGKRSGEPRNGFPEKEGEKGDQSNTDWEGKKPSTGRKPYLPLQAADDRKKDCGKSSEKIDDCRLAVPRTP